MVWFFTWLFTIPALAGVVLSLLFGTAGGALASFVVGLLIALLGAGGRPTLAIVMTPCAGYVAGVGFVIWRISNAPLEPAGFIIPFAFVLFWVGHAIGLLLLRSWQVTSR